MGNETLFLVRAVIDLVFILLMYRFGGRSGLIAAIVANLLLVSVFGSRLAFYFGFETNAGNVFYASVFFATNLINEHYRKKAAMNSIIIGFSALMLFVIMGLLTLRFASAPEMASAGQALSDAFTAIPRIAFASMFAYLIAQFTNVWLYDKMRARDGRKQIWRRVLLTAVVAQALDSILFFSIAFFGVVGTGELTQVILTGFVLKIIVALLSVPLMYWSYRIKPIETNS